MDGMEEIVKEFLLESNENLDQLDRDFVELEKNPSSRELLARIFRAIHTLKGTSGVLGFQKLESVAHVGENLLSKLRDGEIALSPQITSGLLAMVDRIRELLRNIEESGAEGDGDYQPIVEMLSRLLAEALQSKAVTSAAAEAKVAAAEPAPAEILKHESAPATCPTASETTVSSAEPRLMGEVLTKKFDVPPEAVADALDQQSQGDPRKLGEILVERGQLQPHAVLEALQVQGGEAQASAVAASTIRVDVALLDKLMNLVGELVLARNQILQFTASQKDTTFIGTAQRLNLITTELQEGVMKTRMQPIGNVWNKFPRVVRDLAVSCGKKIRIEMEGTETELDKTILEAIKDPLTHIVRNSIDHGLEQPEARTAAGKSPEGRLFLCAYHEGGQVNIEISDDGAGINLQRVKTKAIERGVITQEQAARMSDRELMNLIFLPGFSTAQKVTNVSGRGVGMDVVKTNIEKIGGAVDVHSVSGRGTTIKIKIPLTLAIIPALIATSGNERFAIPQVSLLELVRIEEGQAENGIEMIHDAPVYRLRGHLLPLVYLNKQLKLSGQAVQKRTEDKEQSSHERLSHIDFEDARGKHRAWKQRLVGMLESGVAISDEQLGSHKTCKLGEWLYGYAVNEYRGVPAITQLRAKHAEFHAAVSSVVSHHRGGRLAEAQQEFRRTEDLSEGVIALISEVERGVRDRKAANIVVLQADGRQFGLVVDEINDTEEIVVKPMGKQLKGLSCFAGATIMGDGKVALILDVLGLAQMGNVVNEVKDRAALESGGQQADRVTGRDAWLVFLVGGDRRMAIPLSKVSRLEEFQASAVEHSGRELVVQYRGEIMPLLDVAEKLNMRAKRTQNERLQVVVYSAGGRAVGLLVDQIVDIVDEVAIKECRTAEESVKSAVIQDRVTDLLDIQGLVAMDQRTQTMEAS